MSHEPLGIRAVALIDGQNLFHSAREAFGYTYPNYAVGKRAQAVRTARGWQLQQTRFYTGVPDLQDHPFWHGFWSNKLLAMRRAGIVVFSRTLRYRNQRVALPDGNVHTFLVGEEKDIDVRIALDIIRGAHRAEYDVARVFSQDQDLSEAAAEIRVIAHEQNRWIKVVSSDPVSPTVRNRRGINQTDWFPIDRARYGSCIDPRDYRPKKL